MLDVERPATGDDSVPIGFGPAAVTWLVGWALGLAVVGALVLAALGGDGDDDTIPQIAGAGAAGWIVSVGALSIVSRRFGSGDLRTDFALRFQPVDLAAVPLGIAAQLVLVPAVYLPLRHWWPDTFSQAKLDERAQDLADRAGGASTVLLVLMVVVGAPLVEELMYRGLIQRSLGRVVGSAGAFVLTSLWFALVHFVPVEYPGLFVAGLVFGGCLVATGRIGTSILAHAAFNATGIAFALA